MTSQRASYKKESNRHTYILLVLAVQVTTQYISRVIERSKNYDHKLIGAIFINAVN
jgi:hypothetical protein